MALLDLVEYSPGESIQNMYDKINAAITAINNALSGTKYRITTLQIGDWNMDSTVSATVTHGLTRSKIRAVMTTIKSDSGSAFNDKPINVAEGTGNGDVGGGVSIGDTVISLFRVTGGTFDSADYDSTSYNRGYVTIIYEE